MLMKQIYVSPEVEVLPVKLEAALLQLSSGGEDMNPITE